MKGQIVKPSVIDYEVNEGSWQPLINQEPFRLTDYSQGQVLERAHIPRPFMEGLMNIREFDLAKQNLKTLTNHYMEDGVMVRRIGDLIKGWLSPSYKRMDAGPVFDTFIERALQKGMVPYRAYNTDYRYQIAFIVPEVISPYPEEFIVVGLSMTTGDYGAAALLLEMMILRIRCQNLALGYDVYRRVHLGSRFHAESDYVQLSKKTIELDNRTVASAMGDVVDHGIKQIDFMKQVVTDANNKEIANPQTFYDRLKKKGFSKELVETVKTTYESDLPLDILPPQKSLWRMSNALSFVAQSQAKVDRRIDLEKASMDLLLAA